MIKNSNFNFLIVFHFFAFFLFILLTIEKDLPESISTSRAPWIDESLKNYIAKNFIEYGTAQPYEENEIPVRLAESSYLHYLDSTIFEDFWCRLCSSKNFVINYSNSIVNNFFKVY